MSSTVLASMSNTTPDLLQIILTTGNFSCPQFWTDSLLVKTFHCSFIDRISIWHVVSHFFPDSFTEGFSYPVTIPYFTFILDKFFSSTLFFCPKLFVYALITELKYPPIHIPSPSSWLLNHLKAQVILRKCSSVTTQFSFLTMVYAL